MRKLTFYAIAALLVVAALLAFEHIAAAQGIGITTDTNSMSGDGSSTNPLGMRRSCGAGQHLVYDGASWGCALAGDITSVGAVAGGGLTGGASSGVALLQLISTCSDGQVLKSTTGLWGCANDTGGISNSAGANVVMKSDGTNAVATGIVDNGTEVLMAARKLGIGGASPSGSQQVWGIASGASAQTITTQVYALEDDTGHTGVGINNEAISFVGDQRATFNCVFGVDCNARSAEFDVTSSKSSGTGTLINIAVAANAQNGDQNYSFLGIHGILSNVDPSLFGDVTATGHVTTSGEVDLVGTAGSQIAFTGAGGAITTTGAIQGSSLTSTANTNVGGELVLTAATDEYFYSSRANTAGTVNINLDTAGSGILRINSNTGGLANAGTGGVEFYGGANGSTVKAKISGTGGLTLSDDMLINTNKFTVQATTGNTLVAGTLSATGNVAVNTNKFTVAASTGNTLVAGTLDSTGDVKVNTNKFIVTASSGDTVSAGNISGANLTASSTVSGTTVSVENIIKTKTGCTQPTLTCGTSPVQTGCNFANTITIGTGSPGTCVMTFSGGAKSSIPSCTVTAQDGTFKAYAVTVNAVTITSPVSGHLYDVTCVDH